MTQSADRCREDFKENWDIALNINPLSLARQKRGDFFFVFMNVFVIKKREDTSCHSMTVKSTGQKDMEGVM